MTRTVRAMFRFDPGWLFILAGLAVCVAGILVSAEQELHGLRWQLEQLGEEETSSYARLNAHAEFLGQLERQNPVLIRRLAAAQLNLVQEGETPVLLVSSRTANVTDWIDASVQIPTHLAERRPETMLSRLTNGPYRLWLFAGGVMCVFVGLLLDPSAPSVNHVRMFIASRWRVDEAARTCVGEHSPVLTESAVGPGGNWVDSANLPGNGESDEDDDVLSRDVTVK